MAATEQRGGRVIGIGAATTCADWFVRVLGGALHNFFFCNTTLRFSLSQNRHGGLKERRGQTINMDQKARARRRAGLRTCLRAVAAWQ